MNKSDIINMLNKYGFDKSEYIVLSSSAMVMYGIKNKANDIDLAVSSKLLKKITEEYKCTENEYTINGKNVKYYTFDVFDFGTNYFELDNITYIDNIPVQNINLLLEFKKSLIPLNRSKDLEDIKLLNKYLNLLNMNSLSLAYLGDAVYELYIRRYLINKGIIKVNELQKEAIKYVSAKAQSVFLDKMFKDNFLKDGEIDIIKRARNHKSHKSKTTDIITYKKSTGLEALIGYLDLNSDNQRIEEIINYIVGD